MDRTASFYSQPSYHFRGAGFPVFSGSRRQRGGGILGSIGKMITPMLGNLGKSIGRAALKRGVSFASDIAKDVMTGKKLTDSMKTRGKQHAIGIAKSAARQGLNTIIGRKANVSRKRALSTSKTNSSLRKKKR